MRIDCLVIGRENLLLKSGQLLCSYLRTHFRATGIKSPPDTTGFDTISLTYKTPFRILNSRKSNFLSINC
jgi:hypothetical protein